MLKKLYFFIFFQSFILGSFSQNYKEKSFYLIDELNLNDLNEEDSKLLDSCLTVFHKSKNDTLKLSAINYIVETCSNDLIWPKYNLWLNEYIDRLDISTFDNKSKRVVKKYKAMTINNFGYELFYKGDYEKTIPFFEDALKIQTEINDTLGKSTSINNIGLVYSILGKNDAAIKYYLESLKYEIALNNIEGIASTLNNIGNLYEKQGDIKKALQFYDKALELYKRNKDKNGVALLMNNIGGVYLELGDLDKALVYYKASLKIRKEQNDLSGIANSYNNIGFLFTELKDYDKALELYQKAILIHQKLGNKDGIAGRYNNIAKIYAFKGDLKSALYFYENALNLFTEVNNIEGIILVQTNIGRIEYENGHISNAKFRLEKALELAKEIDYPELISNSSNILSSIAENQKNYKKSLELYKLHIKTKEIIDNDENKKAIYTLQAQYEYDKQKVIDDKVNDKKIALAEKEKEKQKLIALIITGILILIVVFSIFIYNRLQLTRKQKNIIELQKETVEKSRKKIKHQKDIIEETHREITDSINYAKRLQKAILPSIEDLQSIYNNFFIYYNPKSVVSGDFYWFEQNEEYNYVAVADCTGHGVPGAMVSVVCSNALNRTVNEFKIKEPSKILDKTREIVIETFSKSGKNIRDGMDISLCAFTQKHVIFSGANNSLYISRRLEFVTEEQKTKKGTVIQGDKAIIEFKGTKQPVGYYEKTEYFSQHKIRLKRGDVLYLFSDGYADQFGGQTNKKLKTKPFKKLLLSISDYTVEQQKLSLRDFFIKWKGDFEQVDDICIVGISV